MDTNEHEQDRKTGLPANYANYFSFYLNFFFAFIRVIRGPLVFVIL